jgi:hypothetical protein
MAPTYTRLDPAWVMLAKPTTTFADAVPPDHGTAGKKGAREVRRRQAADRSPAMLLNAEREFEPESPPPWIAFRTAINSLRVPNHILLTLFDDFR